MYFICNQFFSITYKAIIVLKKSYARYYWKGIIKLLRFSLILVGVSLVLLVSSYIEVIASRDLTEQVGYGHQVQLKTYWSTAN